MKSAYATAVLGIFVLVFHQASSTYIIINSEDQMQKEIKDKNAELVLLYFYSKVGEYADEIHSNVHGLSDKYGSKLKLLEIDVEKFPGIQNNYDLVGQPAFAFLHDGGTLYDKLSLMNNPKGFYGFLVYMIGKALD